MKPLMVVIVVAALAAGSVVWAGSQGMDYSWGQHHWPRTNQMQMASQMPMAGQTIRESRTDAAYSVNSQRCSHWYGGLIPGHRANGHAGHFVTEYDCRGSHRCR